LILFGIQANSTLANHLLLFGLSKLNKTKLKKKRPKVDL